MRRFAPVLIGLPLLLALVAGCGGGSSSSSTPGAIKVEGAHPGGAAKKATAPNAPNAPAGAKVFACRSGAHEMRGLRSTAVGCGPARTVMRQWERSHACRLGEASRSSCTLDGFRCQAIRSGGAASVSCARPGGDVAFLVRSRPLRKSGSG